MIKVYISSPYTIGDKETNVRRQIDTAKELIDRGFCPFVPTLYHHVDMLYPYSWETWMEIDISWIKSCDCILRLPGTSKGADMEVEHALRSNIPVFMSLDSLLVSVRKIVDQRRTRRNDECRVALAQ